MTAARDGSRRLVAAADEAALAIGLRPGQTIAHAQASVPGLVVVEAEPEADLLALGELARWCGRYSPVVQADPPDGVLIDIAGSSHLFGGETGAVRDLLRRVRRSGYSAHASLADTPGAAWAVARFGGGGIVPTGGAAKAVAPLPVAALRLEGETCRALALLGVERVGQLAALPRAQLTRRFVRTLFERYERVTGLAPDPLAPIVPREAPCVRRAFPEPLGHLDALAAALERLTGELCRELERRGEGLRLLDTILRRVDGQPVSLRVGASLPTRDPAHCVRLVGERLQTVDPGFGIDEMALLAARVEPLRARQEEAVATLEAETRDAAALAPLVDRLGVRLGTERVFRAAPVESRVPERSVKRVPALAPVTGISWPEALPRPSRIIDPPEEVRATALLPDYPPKSFVWRRVRYNVASADGPERVHGEWWISDAKMAELRDYYRVEDEKGRRFWLFRNAPTPEGTRWWLHGRFT
ncbi:Y-family DNA polymerase [Enterovirga aerilata]|uniref:DNA-directed DNA polymerase n=1 Tax=Enterovirga aerilata TaxID=2730920 RepID=A0A849HY69_9HYPH|nr:DNA polymerase Y family protein [Enterovirga sp. DB1703]